MSAQSDDGTRGLNATEAIIQEFGDTEEVRQHLMLLKAVHSLLDVAAVYYLSPEGSINEHKSQKALSQMMADAQAHPEKARQIIEALCALVVHLREGGTYDEWFEGVGNA